MIITVDRANRLTDEKAPVSVNRETLLNAMNCVCVDVSLGTISGVEMKALLFWYHGYAAHINGPTFREFAEGMAAGGYAVIAVDQHGHGYRCVATRCGVGRPKSTRLLQYDESRSKYKVIVSRHTYFVFSIRSIYTTNP